MITLLLTVAAAGAANVALVAFMVDRLGPKAGTTVSAGEFVALLETGSASAKRGALRVSNENVLVGATQRAA
ncbi:hypothetical protein OCOJLMKI_3275 [Methylobacterium iners]|uniref:Uncharacterized protein n=2 Tax=Methylobacterium iners TaxID=418707 RepID=A0ABQ4S2Q3_9HYPH|nr:hypothetical protein OCOJLMKI_3275 [Methylobacterium iners]